MASDSIFREKAPGIMNLLMADFGLDVESAAAILGNLGHESGGFRFLQEKQPMIAGSAGGFGWAQWTGPRRREYEAYCSRNGYDPSSDTANYKFLFVELSGSERAAIPAVKNAVGLDAKVKAFEMAFERAGIKGYESRNEWAQKALDAYRANPGGTIDVKDIGHAVEGEILLPVKADKHSDLLTTLLPGVLQAILPVVVKQVKGEQVDIPSLIKQVADTVHKQTPPPAAGTPVSERPSVWLSALTAIGAAALQAHGDLGTPVGPNATTTGLMTNVLTVGSTVFAAVGGWAGIGKMALKLFALIPK